MEPIILSHYRAPGDVMMLTALVRDLKQTYPDKYKIYAHTPYPYIWYNNPHIESHLSGDQTIKGVTKLSLGYGEFMPKAHSTEKRHFVTAFHADFKKKKGIHVPLSKPHGDLHLAVQEKLPIIEGRYWLVLTGGKSDFKTKHWRYLWHQETANALMAAGIRVVTAGAVNAGGGGRPASSHPRLAGAIDMIGKTSLREFIRLIDQADGVIGPVTFAMHAAAALGKPYVCIAGGVEEWWWEGYSRDNPGFGGVGSLLKVDHRYLHTLGLLSCCERKGCWRTGVAPPDGHKSMCHQAIKFEEQTLPRCMAMITPERVAAAVFSYYLDGTLEPGPDMSIPAIDHPVTIKTTTGRTYAVSLSMVEPGEKIPLPVMPTTTAAPASAKLPIQPRPAKQATQSISREDALARVGGKVTGFLLCYGDFPDMHARCLSAIINSTTPAEYELRVFLNSVCAQTKAVVEKYKADGKIALVYESAENCYKYPAMRRMFHDPANPITTDWLVWFDDDTMADVDPQWLPKLCNVIADSTKTDPATGLIGPKFSFKISPANAEWIRAGTWHRNRPFRDTVGKTIPNGDRIHFATGSCWALRSSLVKEADIPDTRLRHNGGDVLIGEQVYQAGGTLKQWNPDRKQVHWSSVTRRGASLPMFS